MHTEKVLVVEIEHTSCCEAAPLTKTTVHPLIGSQRPQSKEKKNPYFNGFVSALQPFGHCPVYHA